jgi:hypothetical protein
VSLDITECAVIVMSDCESNDVNKYMESNMIWNTISLLCEDSIIYE